MQQMNTVGCLAFILTGVTRQLYGKTSEEGQASGLVLHAHEACVEIDLRCEGADAYEAGVADDHERGHCLVEEARVHIGSLLQYEDVATSALCGSHLPRRLQSATKTHAYKTHWPLGMSHVDLTLAASYVPGFICLLKLMCISLLGSLFLSHGMLTLLWIIVLLDSVLTEPGIVFNSSTVLAHALAFLTVTHFRSESEFHTALEWVPGMAWAALALLQSFKEIVQYELVAVALLCGLLSLTYQPVDTMVISTVRVATWGLTVLVYLYTAPHEEPRVLMFRVGFIMLVHIAAAVPLSIAVVSLVLLRTGAVEQDVEAQLLREALAKHKGSA